MNDDPRIAAPAPSDWRAHYWLRRLHDADGPDGDVLVWHLETESDHGAVLAAAMALPATFPALAQDFALEGADLQGMSAPAAPPHILRAPDLAAALRKIRALRFGADQPLFRVCLILTPNDSLLAIRVSRIAGGDGLLAQITAHLAGQDTGPEPDSDPVLSRAPLDWMARETGSGEGAVVTAHVPWAGGDGLCHHAARALAAALSDLGGPADISVLPDGRGAVDLARAAAAHPGGPVVVGLLAPDDGLRAAPTARRLPLPPPRDPVGPAILLGLRPAADRVLAELSCAPDRAPGLAALLMDRLVAHWDAPPRIAAASDPLALILQEFRMMLAAPDMGPDDDFFDRGGHSLTATRIVGRLARLHGLRLRFEDVFAHPTARALAATAQPEHPDQSAAPEPPAPALSAPLSLAQASLWTAYVALGRGDIFNIPFALRFLDPVDEIAFEAAFRDLLIRHPILRSLFTEDAQGRVTQMPVPVTDLDSYDWFRGTGGSGASSAAQEARHVFDLATQLPLRLRFFQDGGQQVLSLLFHHIVLDEWSVDLLMTDLDRAYGARAAGRAPVWDNDPAPFADFARAQAQAGPGDAHLAYWTDRLRGAPARRPFTTGDAPGAGHDTRSTDGGWREIAVPPPISAGLYQTARAAHGSLFNIVYAAIAAALRGISGQDDLVIGTSAAARGDAAFFDTIGYFTTVVAHRLTLADHVTPLDLTEQVRDMINGSLPHDEIPIDLVEQALGHPGPAHLFELFIQIHAGNRLNGALTGPGGRAIRYRQIDPDKTESLLGLQFELLEDVIDGERDLRVMMSYRTDSYGPEDVARLVAAVSDMFARFADPAARAVSIAARQNG